MAVPKILNTMLNIVIIVLFGLSLIEAATVFEGDVPWYEDLYNSVGSGDYTKVIDMIKMGIGWSSITPTMRVEMIPFPLSIYGYYYSLFMPEGYIPIPSIELLIFIFAVSIFILIPLALIIKFSIRGKKNQKSEVPMPLGIPIWFYLMIPVIILLLYPVWVWFNLLLFMHGVAGFFNTDLEMGKSIWLSYSQNTQGITVIMILASGLGMFKALQIARRTKKVY